MFNADEYARARSQIAWRADSLIGAYFLFELACKWKLQETPPVTLTAEEIAAGLYSSRGNEPQDRARMMEVLQLVLPHVRAIDVRSIDYEIDFLFGCMVHYGYALRGMLGSVTRHEMIDLLREWSTRERCDPPFAGIDWRANAAAPQTATSFELYWVLEGLVGDEDAAEGRLDAVARLRGALTTDRQDPVHIGAVLETVLPSIEQSANEAKPQLIGYVVAAAHQAARHLGQELRRRVGRLLESWRESLPTGDGEDAIDVLRERASCPFLIEKPELLYVTNELVTLDDDG